MAEIVSLEDIRNNKEWVRKAHIVFPLLEAIEQATDAEKQQVELFLAACRLRPLIAQGDLVRRRVWGALRDSAWKMPPDVVGRTISAGLYESRKTRRKNLKRAPR
jgi:hypothetical protein